MQLNAFIFFLKNWSCLFDSECGVSYCAVLSEAAAELFVRYQSRSGFEQWRGEGYKLTVEAFDHGLPLKRDLSAGCLFAFNTCLVVHVSQIPSRNSCSFAETSKKESVRTK